MLFFVIKYYKTIVLVQFFAYSVTQNQASERNQTKKGERDVSIQ